MGLTTYAFQKWEDGTTNLSRSVTLNADKTITATYVAVHPTLALASSPSGAGTLTATPLSPYDVGETVVINASVNDPVNYSFSKWLNEDGTTFSTSAETSAHAEHTRQWKLQPHPDGAVYQHNTPNTHVADFSRERRWLDKRKPRAPIYRQPDSQRDRKPTVGLPNHGLAQGRSDLRREHQARCR